MMFLKTFVLNYLSKYNNIILIIGIFLIVYLLFLTIIDNREK